VGTPSDKAGKLVMTFDSVALVVLLECQPNRENFKNLCDSWTSFQCKEIWNNL